MKKTNSQPKKTITPAPKGVFTPGIIGLDGEPYATSEPKERESSSQNVPKYDCGVYGATQDNGNIFVPKPLSRGKTQGLSTKSR